MVRSVHALSPYAEFTVRAWAFWTAVDITWEASLQAQLSHIEERARQDLVQLRKRMRRERRRIEYWPYAELGENMARLEEATEFLKARVEEHLLREVRHLPALYGNMSNGFVSTTMTLEKLNSMLRRQGGDDVICW